MKLLITLIIIVLILLYLTKNKVTVKKIKDFKYKNLIRNELFQVNNEDNLCPKLDPNIIFKMFEPKDNSYFGMINNNQPFIEYDSIKMIVESKNFIFFLNQSMTEVIKLDKITGSMLNITDKLIEELNLINEDNTMYVISMIGACFETDECFAFVKKYNSDNWENKELIIPYDGELWKLDPVDFFLRETKLKDSGIGNIKLDLVGKLQIEAKIIYDKTYYNIYAIQKISLGINNYKTVLINLHGSSIENKLNFYYGDIESIGLNCRYIGNFEIDENVVSELITNSKLLNVEEFNLFNLQIEYDNLNNNIKFNKYKNIFQFVNTNFFKNYLNNPENEIQITENLVFYNEILVLPEFQGYATTDTEIDFNNRLDNIKKTKTLKFARECLKLMNLYKDILVNEGLNFGVQDFNVNSERIIIQATNVKSNSKLSMKYIRFNTDFIKDLILNDHQVDYLLKLYDNSEPKFNYNSLLNYESTNVKWNRNQGNKVELEDNLFVSKGFITKYRNKIDENKILENGNILIKSITKYRNKIDENKILENGNILIKSNTDNSITLQISQNNGDINEKGYNKYQSNLNGTNFLNKDLQKMNNQFEYLMNFNDKENNFSYNSLFKIRPGSITGNKQIYGILDYVGGDLVDKNIFHKQPVYFTLYAVPKDEPDKKGPIYLSVDLNIHYELNPSVKFEHSGTSLYNWFVSQEKEGKFKNRRDWFEIYDLMKQEGIYYPNPKEGYQIKNSNFNNIMKYLKDSILEDTAIMRDGLFLNRHMKSLLKIKDAEVYNTDLDDFYPQLHLYKEPSLEQEEYYIYINFNPDNQNKNALELSRISGINTEIEFIGLDKEPENFNINNINELSDIRKENFEKKKYVNRDDNYKNEYHILVTKNKKEITKYPKNDPRKINYIWKMKKINNFSEYLNLITDNVQISKNARDRVRGLYDIDKKFMDRDYLNYLLEKKSSNPNSEQLDEIIEIAKNNLNNYNRSVDAFTYYSVAHAYPFMVIYTYVDYNGDACQEESKNSQKLFLTTKILKEHIINKENPDKKYTELKQYPFIKEEFLSFTGYGNDIQFYGKKLGGSTPIVPKQFCNYKPLPIEECVADSCSPKKLGLVRLDGSPKCQIEDSTVKQKLDTPNYVEIIGNVSKNACDLFKLKGNKKLYYRLGRIFKYGRDGKYQLKNMYTIQQSFDNKYFFFGEDKVKFKNNLDLSKIDSYTFEGIPKTDIYGMYYVFKPLNNDKYLTRKINVFDRQFESWALEDLKDISQVQRNKEDPQSRIHKDDPDYYSQKFSIPNELIINMATQDKVTNPEITGLQEDLRKRESLRCKTSPQLCEGDVSYEESMTPIEENKFLNKQLEDIRNMMNKINQVPASFTEPPNMVGLANKIKQLKNIIPEIEVKIIKTIKANKYLLELENLRKNEEEKQTLLKKQEKINLSSNSNNNMNKNNNQSFFNRALEGIKTTFNSNVEQPKCYSLEKFSNYNTNSSLNSHVSDEYSDYIEGKMSETRNKVADMQKEVGENLAKISELASSLKLNGSTKQILLSDKINQDNDLNKDIFKIKNADQQQRVANILQKISEIEKIRSEMEEDDFKTNKQENEEQYGTLISRTDGESINMYNVNSEELPEDAPSESNQNLLFINNGCLSYDNKLNISQQHCMIGNTNQMFQMHRIEDINDMKKYNIKNQQKGMNRSYNIIRANDNKCLHKENNELSFRNCDNIENQYWDYSNITGSNN